MFTIPVTLRRAGVSGGEVNRGVRERSGRPREKSTRVRGGLSALGVTVFSQLLRLCRLSRCARALLTTRCRIAALALLATGVSAGFAAAQPPEVAPGAAVDRRAELPLTTAPSTGQLEAVAELRDSLSGSLLESYDPASGVTRSLFNPSGKLSAASGGGATDIAYDFVSSNLDLLGLHAGDLDEMVLCDAVFSSVTGATHVYYCQRHLGLPVVNAQLHVNVSGDGSILSVNNSFVPELASQAAVAVAAIDDHDACTAVANHLGVPLGPDGLVRGEDLSSEPVEAELSWLPVGRRLELVWRFSIHTPDGAHVYD